MSNADLDRLKADASGNTGLSEALAEAIPSFVSMDDAVNFLSSRGFTISARDLTEAASGEAREEVPVGQGEGGYGALLRFVTNH